MMNRHRIVDTELSPQRTWPFSSPGRDARSDVPRVTFLSPSSVNGIVPQPRKWSPLDSQSGALASCKRQLLHLSLVKVTATKV